MGATTKPRRKYRPRPVAANPMQLAMRRAGRIPAAELDEVMGQIEAAFRALREGVATEFQWVVLASSVELGLAVELQGVVTGLEGHLRAAEAALQAIYKRAMEPAGEWRPTALYWQEIEAVDTVVWLHREQLQRLSEAEWRRAHARAVGVVRSAGGRAVDNVEALPAPVQLQLLGDAR